MEVRWRWLAVQLAEEAARAGFLMRCETRQGDVCVCVWVGSSEPSATTLINEQRVQQRLRQRQPLPPLSPSALFYFQGGKKHHDDYYSSRVHAIYSVPCELSCTASCLLPPRTDYYNSFNDLSRSSCLYPEKNMKKNPIIRCCSGQCFYSIWIQLEIV